MENQISAVFLKLETKGLIPKLLNMETYLAEEKGVLKKLKNWILLKKLSSLQSKSVKKN